MVKYTHVHTQTNFSYIPAIDGLRAVSAFLVFATHAYHDKVPGGIIGVDIFFAISGFLITSILLREADRTGTISIRDFYMKRSLRILPAALFFFTFVYLFANGAMGDHGQSASLNFAAAVFSFMNWLRAFTDYDGNYLAHSWSLSVEEQFYAIWSLVVLVLVRKGSRKTLAPILVATMALIIAWKSYLGISGATPARILNGLDTRADAILIGALFACVPIDKAVRLASRFWLIPIIGLLIVLRAADDKSNDIWMFLPFFTAISACLLLVALGDNIIQRLLSSPLAVYFGKRSYSFYLWHYPIVAAMWGSEIRRTVWILPTFLLSLIAAELSYRFIETPFLNLRHRKAKRNIEATGAISHETPQ
ncbi:acyltransferase family protein [Rhizobium sp. ZW T2_16]|uniref:acyltransferase family protein n=1 Tax=Rhizobium sp. ZW T2_16 TaxID=3378083 RepID=UPI0038532EA7